MEEGGGESGGAPTRLAQISWYPVRYGVERIILGEKLPLEAVRLMTEGVCFLLPRMGRLLNFLWSQEETIGRGEEGAEKTKGSLGT